MSRFSDEELEELKRSVDLAALIRSKGIELKAHGSKDLAGLSPFTDEKTPSLIVTPSKNLWHCMSSGQGGSVIDFVMKFDGVSFRHAVLLLKEANPQLFGGKAVSKATARKLDCPLDPEADDGTLFSQVLDYYQNRLVESPAALVYLKGRGIDSPEALKKFRIGYADRTLGLRLPNKNRQEGRRLRERLTKLGIYRESGHEHFNGCLVFPIFDEGGTVREIYGRRIGAQKSGIYHLYLPGPHGGVWNAECLRSPEVILCESLIDALTFWVSGFRNVTCIYGTEGFTDELLEAFRRKQTQRVFLAYDADAAGDRAAQRDASRLLSMGIEVYRLKFPAGHDANEYVGKVKPAGKSLDVLIKSAQWLGKSTKSTKAAKLVANDEEAAKDEKVLEESKPEPQPKAPEQPVVPEKAAPEVKPSKGSVKVESKGEDHLIRIGDREYRVRGLFKNNDFDVLKVNLRLLCNERFYLDTFDFYRAKERGHFVAAAASETALEPDLVKRDLGRVLLALEEIQEKRLREESELAEAPVELTKAQKEEAMELLKSPELLKRILEDFDRCGIVGEATNKLTGYLAAVSRKLDKPLAIIIQSTSAAGKTSLMEAVLSMMPEEERVKYSAMTGQSLYYLGETNLQHKILAIVEEEGAEKASYALKLLQSEGELTIASTGKDDQGRMKTEEYHVKGPVMIFLTTTAIDIDEELLNRCLVLTVDESREQTKAIHNLQREAETFEGLKRQVDRDRILTVHRNAQRLLEPLAVVNPFAKRLTFLSDRTRTRRDHMKYLTLIRSIALLHQHQRPIQEKAPGVPGQAPLRYVEVTVEDIAAANELAHEVLGRSLDELPPQTRRLLGLLRRMVERRCEQKGATPEECLFTRREVREFTGWSQTQLKVHLDRLEEFEYILSRRGMRGSLYEYELLFGGDTDCGKSQLVGLIDPKKLGYDGKLSGFDEELSGQKVKLSPRKRVQNAPKTGSLRGKKTGGKVSAQAGSRRKTDLTSKNAQEALKIEAVVS